MVMSLRSSLDAFDAAVKFERYNVFNCHHVGKLMSVEIQLAESLSDKEVTTPETVHAVRACIDYDLGARLIAFSLRMASAALQFGSAELVTAGTVALALDDDQVDERDVWLCLAVLHDAGSRLQQDMNSILQHAASLATPRRRLAILNAFGEGPEYMRSLSSMGVELRRSPAGPVYVVRMD